MHYFFRSKYLHLRISFILLALCLSMNLLNEQIVSAETIRLSEAKGMSDRIRVEVIDGKYKLKSGTTAWTGSDMRPRESDLTFSPGLSIIIGDGGVTLRGKFYSEGTKLLIDNSGNLQIPSTKRYSFTIIASPAGSTIKIMNIRPKYKPGILLKPGKYDIYISHPDYNDFRQWIEIRDFDTTINVILKKK